MSTPKITGILDAGFGMRLKDARLKLGLSRKDLAKCMCYLSDKYPEMHIYRLETGKAKPTVDQLFQLADLFRVDARWLAYGNNDQLSKRFDINMVYLRRKNDSLHAAMDDYLAK